jgi:HAD superfamily hydrolase (TIGR01509 family)
MAVLFDMDGVLIDSTHFHEQSFPVNAVRFGFSEAEARKASAAATTMITFYQELQKIRAFPVSFEEFSDIILERLFTLMTAGGVTSDPELVAFLHTIRQQGVEVAVGTSAMHKSAVRKLAMVELHNEFDIIVTADDVPQHKPFPHVYLEAARRLGVDPHHCVVIDDTDSGLLAGKRAGCKTIGFTKYLTGQAHFEHADETANSFAELSYERLRSLLNR